MKHAALYEKIFGEKYIKEVYKYEPHNFNGTIAGKKYCLKCGLVALNNSFTKWGIDKGCNNKEHPGYENQRKKAKLK